MNVIIFVLEDIYSLLLIEKIQTAASVDFEEADSDRELFFRILKHFFDNLVLQLVHCESFARTGLPISKTSYNPILD